MNTVPTALALALAGPLLAIGGTASAEPFPPAGEVGTRPAAGDYVSAVTDYDGYILFRKAELSAQRAGRR